MMTRWERLDDYIDTEGLDGSWFNSRAVAADLGITPRQASELIRSHQHESMRPAGRTRYMLHRQGRTSTAVWHVGTRAADARGTTNQFVDDIGRRLERAVQPTLIRMGVSNPRVAQLVAAQINLLEATIQNLLASI